MKGTPTISSDKTRAVVAIEEQYGTSYTYLDISDSDNIKELLYTGEPVRYDMIKFEKMKEGDYVLFLRKDSLNIYDYNSGELLSSTEIPGGSIANYPTIKKIEDNYAIVSKARVPDGKEVTYKIDFTDRRNPVRSIVSSEESLTTKDKGV